MGRIPDHLLRLAQRVAEGRWVTIGAKADPKRPGKKKGGTPVELDGEGVIQKGPAALTGKRPSELSQSHLFTGQPHKSQRKLFAEPGDPVPPPRLDPEAKPQAQAPAKKEPKPKAKKPQNMSLLAVIRREGGISGGDFEHADFREHGLLGALNKNGFGIDDMAAMLVRGGHIIVPHGVSSPGDHLLQLLKKKTNSLLADKTSELEKDYEAYARAREEALADGHQERELEEVRGRGQEAGADAGTGDILEEIFGPDLGRGGEAGAEEPGDLAGDAAEPASGVDTSFDFGPAAAPKVAEKPKKAPRKPKQKKDWEDKQEEKHQKALADVKAADAEKAAVAAKARELLGKVTDPGQRAELQKLIDRAEGKQEQPAAPTAVEPEPTTKQPHEMTAAEYLRSGRPNYGDLVQTPDGKVGTLQGGGGIGSTRVKVNGVWHDRNDLKLVKRPDKDTRQNLSDEWKAKQKADLEKIEKEHGEVLHKKSMVDSAKKRLQAGTMTQDQYDKFVGSGPYKMTDAETARAEKAQAEIDAIKNRPLEFDQSVHAQAVDNALAMGKDVPANVLAEYPDLAKKYGKGKAQSDGPAAPPAPGTNLFGTPEPTKPKPATTQGLFGEQVPVEDKKAQPQPTAADDAAKGLDWLDQKQDKKTDGTGEMFGGLFSPGQQASQGQQEPVAPPPVEPEVNAKPKVTPPAPKTPYAQRRGSVNFSPVTGPTGHKLVGYNWEHDKVDTVDDRGENRTRKVSAWDRATQADETNRPIVHNFTVQAPDGTTKTVSLETAARLLGFDASGEEPKAKFQSAVSAAKTLAKLQMERAELVQRADRWKKDKADVDRQVEALPDDQIEEVPDTMGRPEYRVFRWKNQPEISIRRKINQPDADREEAKRQARWALADSEMEKRGHKEMNFRPNTAKIDGSIKRAQEKLDELTKQASQPATAARASTLTDMALQKAGVAQNTDDAGLKQAGPVTPPKVGKQPHEMTRAEFAAQGPTDRAKQYLADSGMHRRKVQAALDAGQNVPAEVLAEYPGIKKTEPQQGPTAKEITGKIQAETDASRAQAKQDDAKARVRDVEDYQQARQAAIGAGQDVNDGDEKQMRRMIRQNEKDRARALQTIANNGPDAEAQAYADKLGRENERLQAKLAKSAGPVAPPAVEPSPTAAAARTLSLPDRIKNLNALLNKTRSRANAKALRATIAQLEREAEGSTAPPKVETSKPAHEMTKAEFQKAYMDKANELMAKVKGRKIKDVMGVAGKAIAELGGDHFEQIKKARAAGKAIPQEVLADYPYLKEPHEMTQQEWAAKWLASSPGRASRDIDPDLVKLLRKADVKRAIDAGKQVPASVLADYPDLKPGTEDYDPLSRREDPAKSDFWLHRKTELDKKKPSPINRMFGSNPTAEQQAIYAERLKDWNRKYRQAEKMRKELREKEDAAYKKQSTTESARIRALLREAA